MTWTTVRLVGWCTSSTDLGLLGSCLSTGETEWGWVKSGGVQSGNVHSTLRSLMTRVNDGPHLVFILDQSRVSSTPISSLEQM